MTRPNPDPAPAGAFGLTRDQSAQLIVETALRHGVTDRSQIAYMLATAEHESDNFRTSREYNGPAQARRLGYGGGEEFYGRGYVQITHDHRYLAMGEALGMGTALRDDPERAANDPRLAADLLVVGLQRGLYTGRALDRYINENGVDYANARRVVNGVDRAEHIAELARGWEAHVPSLIEQARENPFDLTPRGDVPRQVGDDRRTNGGSTPPRAAFDNKAFDFGDRGIGVETLQRQLIQAGYTGKDGQPLKSDGDFGPNTKHAVEELQRAHGLEIDGKAGMRSLRALADELQNGRPAPKLPEPERAPGRFEDASLGRDPLFQSLRGHVQTMDRAMGRTPDEASDRVAAALTAEWRANGLTARPDGVVLGQKGASAQPGEYVFAYSGSSERPSDWVGVKTAEAVQTPVDQSLAKAETLQRQQAMEAQQMAQTQQPSNDAPVMSMG